MRLAERTLLFLSLLYLSTNSFYQWNISTTSYLLSLLTTLSLAFYYEGLRLHQVPMIFGLLLYCVNQGQIMTCIATSLTLLSLSLLYLFGECDFKRLKFNGRYQVGYREFRTSKYDNDVSVYYPMDNEEYEKQIGTKNVKWLRHGNKTLLGFAKAGGTYGKDNNVPLPLVRFIKNLEIDCVMNGKLAQDFQDGSRPLIPIIFSHGISANRTIMSGVCRDFATHGYIVFIMDHKDGTSQYVVSSDGKTEQYYDNRVVLYDMQKRKEQIIVREHEMIALIDELYRGQNGRDMLTKIGFDSQVQLDLGKLVAGGHSFGGMTAIKTAKDDPRIKLVATLDPWLFTYHTEIEKGQFQFSIPQICISTAMFHPSLIKAFSSWNILKKLFASAKDPRHENIIVKNTGHLHQCDVASLIPLELYLLARRWPQTSTNDTYLLMSQLILHFLAKVGFTNDSCDIRAVDKFILSMKEKWLMYDILHEGKVGF